MASWLNYTMCGIIQVGSEFGYVVCLDQIESVKHLFVCCDVRFVIWYMFLKWVGRLVLIPQSAFRSV